MAAGDLTATIPQSYKDNAAYFDGVDDDIEINVIPDLSPSGVFSVSAWFKLPVTATSMSSIAYIIGNGVAINTSSFQMGIRNDNGFIAAATHDGSTYRGAKYESVVQSDTWYHVIFTNNGTSEQKLYVNGVDHTDSTGNVAGVDTVQAFIGRCADEPAIHQEMMISDVRIWDRVLTSSEVSKVYGKESVNNGLIHRWKLHEDAKDSIGSNDGTVTGAIFTKPDQNSLLVDVAEISNLAATTDKLICVPVHGRDGKFAMIAAERAAA